MSKTPLDRLREICRHLPEASEGISVHHPSFKVRGKTFVMYLDPEHGSDERAVWCKAGPGAQEALVSEDPERFFVPPYLGHRGWVGIRLDHDVDWDEIAELVGDGYRLAAPKRLVELLDGGDVSR